MQHERGDDEQYHNAPLSVCIRNNQDNKQATEKDRKKEKKRPVTAQDAREIHKAHRRLDCYTYTLKTSELHRSTSLSPLLPLFPYTVTPRVRILGH